MLVGVRVEIAIFIKTLVVCLESDLYPCVFSSNVEKIFNFQLLLHALVVTLNSNHSWLRWIIRAAAGPIRANWHLANLGEFFALGGIYNQFVSF